MTFSKVAALFFGLMIILVLPLKALIWITLVLAPIALKMSSKRLFHVLPFWAILSLPIVLGHPEGSFLIILRSLDSLVWFSMILLLWTQEDSRKVLSYLPPKLRWVVLLILKQTTTFQHRLRQSISAMRLRWGRPPLQKYGVVLKGLFYLLEAKAQNITHALKLREPR